MVVWVGQLVVQEVQGSCTGGPGGIIGDIAEGG